MGLFKIPAKLDTGAHKIQIIFDKKVIKTTLIKIDKARTVVKIPKIIKKHKSKYFKITIKNKETKKLLSNVKVKVKVFTGKKIQKLCCKNKQKGNS